MTSCIRPSRVLDNPPSLIAGLLGRVSSGPDCRPDAASGDCAATAGTARAVDAAEVLKNVRRSSRNLSAFGPFGCRSPRARHMFIEDSSRCDTGGVLPPVLDESITFFLRSIQS